MIRRDPGPVTTLTIDHPASRNALGSSALTDLGSALEAAGADPAVRVVVITATGRLPGSRPGGVLLRRRSAGTPQRRRAGAHH